MIGTLTNYNPATSTLTGGTYNAFSGTIQLSQANTGTGAVITTNAATILLDGASAKIADGSGNNILQGFFTTNAAAGHFTIQNGANLSVVLDRLHQRGYAEHRREQHPHSGCSRASAGPSTFANSGTVHPATAGILRSPAYGGSGALDPDGGLRNWLLPAESRPNWTARSISA